MVPEAIALSDMLNTLEKEDYNIIMDYIRLLSEARKKERAIQTIAVMQEFQDIIGEGRGWDSEESMLEDMAAFRRERLAL